MSKLKEDFVVRYKGQSFKFRKGSDVVKEEGYTYIMPAQHKEAKPEEEK